MEESIKKTIEQLSGTWALVIININYPNKLWVTRNGSPLLLGIEDDYVIVASEQIAFGNHINNYIVLNNNDLIEITKTNETIEYNKNINHYQLNKKIQNGDESSPTNYDHWMIKEIMEQSKSVNCAINNGGRIESETTVKLGGLDKNKKQLLDSDNLILLGCGTSYHAGLWSMHVFKELNIFNTTSIYDGAEFEIKDIPKKGKTVFILLSQSGETKDLQRCIKMIHDNNCASIGVINVVDSFIARETNCGVYLNAGREVAVASTKSFTNQCVILTLIAIWFSQNRQSCIEKRTKLINDLHNLSFHIANLFKKENLEEVKKIVPIIKDSHSMFLLGKGKEEAIAKEGALKIKEVTYIHAEGYSSSALKHGPFGLIVPSLPIIIFDVNETYRSKNKNVYQEVIAREANVIKITEIKDETTCLIIDKNDTFAGLLANIYVQLLAYYVAIEKEYNPDFPRNLAKVVTVE
jgi:glucosamine--fructose-6-phosphate aminotransferase (isomerizing)